MSRRKLALMPLFVALCFTSSMPVSAQQITTSPYDKLSRDKSAWPPFYKPDPSDAQYTKMMAEGWCKPTGWRAQQYYKSKMVDVNALPESTFKGRIVQIQPGVITVADESNKQQPISLMVHEDPAISTVRIQGKGTVELLRVGEFVHFVGRVDGSGRVREPVQKIELTSPGRSEPLSANRQQNLSGKILRVDGKQFTILSNADKAYRLTFELAAEPEVGVSVRDTNFVSVGDTVAAEGRILQGTTAHPTYLFAEDLEIKINGTMPVKTTAAK